MNTEYSNYLSNSLVWAGISDFLSDDQGHLFSREEQSQVLESSLAQNGIFCIRLPKWVLASDMPKLLHAQLDQAYQLDKIRLENHRIEHGFSMPVRDPIDPRWKYHPEEKRFCNNGWMAPDGTIHLCHWHDPGHDPYAPYFLLDTIKMRSLGFSVGEARRIAENHSLSAQGWIKLHREIFQITSWTPEQRAMMKLWQEVMPDTQTRDLWFIDRGEKAKKFDLEKTRTKILDAIEFRQEIDSLGTTPLFFSRNSSSRDIERVIIERLGKEAAQVFIDRLIDNSTAQRAMVAISPQWDMLCFVPRLSPRGMERYDDAYDPSYFDEAYMNSLNWDDDYIEHTDGFYPYFQKRGYLVFGLARFKTHLDVAIEKVTKWKEQKLSQKDDGDNEISIPEIIVTESQLTAMKRWNHYFDPLTAKAKEAYEAEYLADDSSDIPF